MPHEDISFIKPPLSDNKPVRINKAKIVDSSQLPVGGSRLSNDRADKYSVNLQFVRTHLSGKPMVGEFVAKIFDRLPPTEVRKIVDTYSIARQEGFRVPATTRFFAYDQVYGSVLMTDMTENGKYRVWGYNDSAKPEEEKVLSDMNLTNIDLQTIRGKVQDFVELAIKKSRSLYFHNYHVRQDVMSRKLEVFLLDLDTTFLNPPPGNRIQEEADDFITILSLNPIDRAKYLSSKYP